MLDTYVTKMNWARSLPTRSSAINVGGRCRHIDNYGTKCKEAADTVTESTSTGERLSSRLPSYGLGNLFKLFLAQLLHQQ